MRKLRQVTIRDIHSQLDKSVLTKHAFDTSFNDEKKNVVLKIAYRDHPAYFFEIIELAPKYWQIRKAPGILFSDPEGSNHDEFDDYIVELDRWLERLLVEITFDSGKSSSFIDLMRSNLEKAAESVPNPSQPFNDSEAAVWNKKLDEVMAKFEEMEKKNEIQRYALSKLRNEIEEIRKVMRTVPKKTWIRSVGNRVLNMAEQALTRAGAGVAEEQIKKLISIIGDGD
jgi:hypothetical protein